ncbi:MAG: c-type cytochrome [Pseudomonadota bacterium]
MSRSDSLWTLIRMGTAAVVTVLSFAAFAQAPPALSSIGRSATPAEIKAWDIDVRPDFKGLPKGSGSVKQGEVIWEGKCASCHGSFGESSAVFTPIAGGTTADDMKAGRVDGLMPGANQPQRTTLMKVATLSTLWDYINRAMPWNNPKTLSADEVYAVTAYVLNLGNILPAEFTLSDGNIRDVQAMLPNRKGMTTAHAMWPGKELGGVAKPDTQGSACMTNCVSGVEVKSFLPEYARNAHGNLAEQMRDLGPSRGADTTRPAPRAFAGNSPPAAPVQSAQPAKPAAVAALTGGAVVAPSTADVMPVLQKNACLACHGIDSKMVGPGFREIAAKYKGRADAVNYLSGKITAGGQGVWGSIPMPAQSLSAAQAGQVAQWLAAGMPKQASRAP